MSAVHRQSSEALGLPTKAFLYTLDQVATMLAIEPDSLKQYIYFYQRHVGAQPRDRIKARNIAPPGKKPEWRIAEQELIRWLRYKGFRFYENGWVRD